MGLKDIITESIDNIESGGIDSLVGSLEDLTEISRNQFKANESELVSIMGPLFLSIRASLKNNRQQISPSMNLASYIKTLGSLMPTEVRNKYSSQINQLKSEAEGVVIENVIDQFKSKQQTMLQNLIFQQAVQQEDMTNMRFQTPTPAAAMDNQNAIQRSVRTLKPLLRQKLPVMTAASQLPSSVRYLSKFAAMQKKIPVGQATDLEGLAYVGLQKQDMGNGLSRLIPYKKNQIIKTDLPNIPIQFRYHATKTINSWNSFIENQAKFVRFVNEISTANDRTSYVEKQFKNLNISTFSAETLATLVYYYIFIPTQRYLKQNKNGVQTETDFLSKYMVGGYPSVNPLLLTAQGGTAICKLLLNICDPVVLQTPIQLLSLVTAQLKKCTSNINKKQMEKLFHHVQKRRLQTLSFFQTSGVEAKISSSLLAVQDFSSVKKKKFVLNTGYQNNQFVIIAQKITNKVGQTKANTKWEYYWGSQYIPCHDYIWNK